MKKKFIGMSTIHKVWITGIVMCACTFGLSSCSDDYDDSKLRGDVENLKDRVTTLEEWQKSVNTNIQSLQNLVVALENRNYITDVTSVMESGEEVGYRVTFQNGTPITIRHGKNGMDGTDGKDGKDGKDGTDGKDGVDGKDGADGKDGSTPVIGVAQDTDGTYYWTLNSDFLKDGNGNKIPVTGAKGDKGDTGDKGNTGDKGDKGTDAIAPQVRINPTTNVWEVSTDNGSTWAEMKNANGEPIKATGDKGDKGNDGTNGSNGEKGDAVFQRIDYSDPYKVVFTLTEKDPEGNHVIITVPRIAGLLNIEESASDNTFTVTSTLLNQTGNVVDIRVESENADGTTLLTRSAVETRWSVESSIANNVLTITAKPANTVKLNETALLKVTISDSDGKTLASGQKVFTNKLPNAHQAIASTALDLKNALSDATKNFIVLNEDLTIEESLPISSDKEIDLNGKTLKCTKDGQTILNIKEGNVSFSNGTIELHNTYAGGNIADIVVGVDKSQDKSDVVVSKATATFHNIKLSGSIYVSYGSKIEISKSEINSELSGICTNANASNANTDPITVTITDSKLTGETPVFINIPAILTMNNCTIIGGWQGVMMRGGTATINNSTISLEASYATLIEGTNWQKDRNTKDAIWGNGNEVAIAGITMGNNTTSAYQYPTVVTLKNTSVSGYEGYWAVYADATSTCTVDFTYDSQCTFSPELNAEKSFKQGKGTGYNNITIKDGTGNTTKY